MQFQSLAIPDVLLIKPRVFGDERGFFMETYQQEKFASQGIETNFVQDNHSSSKQGILRGLHYQVRRPQGKLVRVIIGEIFDVAVDIRPSSPTFGKWISAVLSAENKHQIWIPKGFAHGFFVTSPWAEVVYKVTDFWYPEYERTIQWDDLDLKIAWPLLGGALPSLSTKDQHGLTFKQAIQEIKG